MTFFLTVFAAVFSALCLAGYILLRIYANALGEIVRLLCDHINECRRAIERNGR